MSARRQDGTTLVVPSSLQVSDATRRAWTGWIPERTTTMFSPRTPASHLGTPGRISRRFTAPIGALALVLLLAGNVAAYELEGDSRGHRVGRLDPTIENQHLRSKFATSAGREVIVRG
jgi:hypothetical protein